MSGRAPDFWADDHSVEELHEIALAMGAVYEERPETVSSLSRVGYEHYMTNPVPPLRWRWSAPEQESNLWLEWHRVRGLDPYKPKRRSGITGTLRIAVIERDGYLCRLCGGEVEPSDVHIDHILPFSAGGPTVLDNLQVAHSRCNIRKGARV